MDDRTVAEYWGARVTPRLVNRTGILETIRRAIEDRPHSHVIYITGWGGMGKTFLVREVLRRCRAGGDWFTPEAKLVVAEDIVDLYHTYTHSKEGLPDAIHDVLGSARADLVNYERKMARFQREKYDLAGMLRELSTLRDGVASTFLEDLNRLSKKYRLVFALDTAEKLLYETDRIQQVLRLSETGTEVLDWLLQEFLPKLENAVVLIAGRPKPKRMREDLQEALGEERLIECNLPGFERPEDAVAYFDAVAEAVRQEGKAEIADRIAAVPHETREVIWLYTGGRPILLSLMIDYLVVADDLLPIVKVPVEEARSKTKEEIKEIEKKIEAEIVRLFQNTGRRADEAIRALAWARKGIDAEMLAHMADMPEAEAQEALDDLRNLSFVKLRPADRRLFLQDEMYEMLQRHVLVHLPRARHEKAYGEILKCYEEKIEAARKEVAALQRPTHEEHDRDTGLIAIGQSRTPEAAEALARAAAHLYTLMPEEVYYRLRRDPADGFRAYYTYRQEAFWANEDSLDMQLRDEMLAFLYERESAQQFDGLTRSDIELDAGLVWSDRFLRKGKYQEALGIARRLRRECTDLVEKGGPLTKAQLDAAEGRALTYSGKELRRAEKLLTSAIRAFEGFEPADRFQAWRCDVSLADALNTQGYLYRVLGRYRDSIMAYERVPPLWRMLAESERAETLRNGIEAQHANTLNNLSWALTWVGDFERAEAECLDGLEMRQRLGAAAPVAFSLNTTGLIQIKNDQPDPGCVNCQRALGIFRDLQQPRGVGLARIALAEAFRRMSNRPKLYTSEEKARLLRIAAEHAKEGVDIFADIVPELPRLIEALIELGCTYRDWASIRDQYKGADPDARILARQGEDALRRAIREGESEAGLLHMVVDAQVNLAWLYHYIYEDERASQEVEAAIARVPLRYFFTKERGRPRRNVPQVFLWVQLGKAHLLHAQVAMRRFRAAESPECLTHLVTAARHYTLSLAYDELFAPSFRDMKHGMAAMYDSLKGLNSKEEFPAIYRGVDEIAQEYHLRQPTRMHKFLDSRFGLRAKPKRKTS